MSDTVFVPSEYYDGSIVSVTVRDGIVSTVRAGHGYTHSPAVDIVGARPEALGDAIAGHIPLDPTKAKGYTPETTASPTLHPAGSFPRHAMRGPA